MVTISAGRFEATVFDLDGVITDTARVHAAAWKDLFDTFLRGRSEAGPWRPFTDDDYRRHVDGKARYDGVTSFLASRSIELPYGSAADPPGVETVCGLGNEKDQRFLARVTTDGVQVFAASVVLVEQLRHAGVSTAVVSASRNCARVLESARITELFDTRVDGVDADDLGLPGKPDPATFVEATRRLGTRPDRCALFEDSLAGVQAGRLGRFALVVGVDRVGQPSPLFEAGAHAVVTDLDQVDVTP